MSDFLSVAVSNAITRTRTLWLCFLFQQERAGNAHRVAVVTLGGGSAMDAGKAIAMLAGQGPDASILDFCICPMLADDQESVDRTSLVPKKFPKTHGVPAIVAIPTTSGTASETNGAAVITDTTNASKHRKLIVISEACKAKLILLDAALTVGVPRYATATCGMDVLTHSLEAFTSAMSNPYGDAVARGAIELVAENLRTVVENPSDLDAREKMHLVSFGLIAGQLQVLFLPFPQLRPSERAFELHDS